MEVTLAQAYAGNKTNIRVPTSVQCIECNGTGSREAWRPKPAAHVMAKEKSAHSRVFLLLNGPAPHVMAKVK